MKALVTGGAGFIGSHIVDLLVAEGHQVAVIDNMSSGKEENVNSAATLYKMDIGAPEVRGVFEKERPEIVFHEAAQISVSYSVRNPIEDATTNIISPLKLLQNCVEFGVGKVVFASSGGTVYGETPGAPATEMTTLSPISPYGITKMGLEFYLKFFYAEHVLKYTILRYFNFYGPRQDPHGEAGVVAIFARAMLEGRTPTINGDGGCQRDYVYAKDVARANILSIDQGHNREFNIGTQLATDVNDIYKYLAQAVGYTTPANYGPPRAGDLRRSVLDISRARAELNWAPQYDFKKGMAETVEFFKGQAAKQA